MVIYVPYISPVVLVHKTVHNAFLYIFRLSDPVRLKKSYLGTYLGYLPIFVSIQKLMTCCSIRTTRQTASSVSVRSQSVFWIPILFMYIHSTFYQRNAGVAAKSPTMLEYSSISQLNLFVSP